METCVLDESFEFIDKAELDEGQQAAYSLPRDAPEADCVTREGADEEKSRAVESLLAITLAYVTGCCQAASLHAGLTSKRVCAAYQRLVDSPAFASTVEAARPAAAHACRLAAAALSAGKAHAAALAGFSERAFGRAAIRAQEARLPQLLLPPPKPAEANSATRLLRALAAFLTQELLLLAFLLHELLLGALRAAQPPAVQAA